MVLSTPPAFRASVEERLRREAMSARRPVNRVRTLLVMERFVARLVAVAPQTFLLKGGFALELRLERARTTRDVDLRAMGASGSLPAILARAATLRPAPEDHLVFRVEPNREHPEVGAAWMEYDGLRFTVTSTLAGRLFGDPFGLDIAYADPIRGEPEILEGSDFFGRYGIPPLRVPVYPVASHLAEKLHAYTMPRPHPSSRAKDLVDIALLSTVSGHDAAEIREAIHQTFAFRRTHPPPEALPDPPGSWEPMVARAQAEDGLPWATVDDVHADARQLLDPVLAGVEGRWDAQTRTWR